MWCLHPDSYNSIDSSELFYQHKCDICWMVTLISFTNYKQYFVYYLKKQKQLLIWKVGFLTRDHWFYAFQITQLASLSVYFNLHVYCLHYKLWIDICNSTIELLLTTFSSCSRSRILYTIMYFHLIYSYLNILPPLFANSLRNSVKCARCEFF
jgi:hypothetical protein